MGAIVGEVHARRLEALGIPDLTALRSFDPHALSFWTGADLREILRWQEAAELSRVGVDAAGIAALAKAGITSVSDLAKTDPKVLHEKTNPTMDVDRLRRWIEAARTTQQDPDDPLA